MDTTGATMNVHQKRPQEPPESWPMHQVVVSGPPVLHGQPVIHSAAAYLASCGQIFFQRKGGGKNINSNMEISDANYRCFMKSKIGVECLCQCTTMSRISISFYDIPGNHVMEMTMMNQCFGRNQIEIQLPLGRHISTIDRSVGCGTSDYLVNDTTDRRLFTIFNETGFGPTNYQILDGAGRNVGQLRTNIGFNRSGPPYILDFTQNLDAESRCLIVAAVSWIIKDNDDAASA